MIDFTGGRKKAKDTKITAKKKRALERAASSEDEARAESTAKTPKSTKKQKVNQEKETRKGQKVRSFSSLTYTSFACKFIFNIRFN